MNDEDMELGALKIKLYLGEAGPYVALKDEGDLSLIEKLGMLELTKSSLLHAAWTEDPDDD